MKCPECNGTGFVSILAELSEEDRTAIIAQDPNADEHVPCARCNGDGVIEEAPAP